MEHDIDSRKTEVWPQVRAIYLEGVDTGDATLEADTPDWDRRDAAHFLEHRLPVRDGDVILAWAAISPVSTRSVYAVVAELSLSAAAGQRDQGNGSALLGAITRSTGPVAYNSSSHKGSGWRTGEDGRMAGFLAGTGW